MRMPENAFYFVQTPFNSRVVTKGFTARFKTKKKVGNMFIARVVGNVWATRKIPILHGKRLLLVQPMNPTTGKSKGKTQMAVCHTLDAGVGDVVLILDEGSSAKNHLGVGPSPVRTFVFAIVDQVRNGDEVKGWT